MTRGLTSAGVALVTAETVLSTRAVELAFASGTVRLCGGLAPIEIAGAVFDPVGMLGGISTMAERQDLQSSGITVTLAGVPRDIVAIARAEPYQGRRATVWEVILDPDTGLVIDAPVIFRGRMDQMNIRIGEQASVELTLEDRLDDMDRPMLSRYSDEDQKRRLPTVRGFEFVSSTAEKEVIWPSRSWRG